jgi:hypothetical protein
VGLTGDSAPPSLRAQTVLYETDAASVLRFFHGVSAACRLARDRGVVGRAVLAVGDSSPAATPFAEVVPSEEWGPFDDVSYLHYGANLGSGGGHNRLFEGLGEDLVLVMNPDTYASPRMIAELVAGLDDPEVGVVEARQLPLEHPKSHDPETGDTSWASGSCFLARARVIAETGGFDPEYFFLYGDDVDFSWRARLRGWRVVHRPSARVFHDKRLTADGFVQAADLEPRYSAEVSVLLPWRYSRPELALARLAELESSPDAVQREVAASLRQRIADGRMPEPIDADHRVGQFVDGEYAVHRFSYAPS